MIGTSAGSPPIRVKCSQRWSWASCCSSAALREPAVVAIAETLSAPDWLGGLALADRLRDALDLARDDLALDLVRLVDVLDRDQRAHLAETDSVLLEPVRRVAAALPLVVLDRLD